MRILMLTRLFDPHIGGVEKHVLEVSKYLIKHKHEVFVVTSKHNQNLPIHENLNDINIFRFSYPKIKFLGLLLIWVQLCKYINFFLTSDIIHIHDVFIWYLPLRFILFFKPVYITFHGWEGKYPIPVSSVIQKKMADFLCRGSICIGEYLKKYFGLKPAFVDYGGVNNMRSLKSSKQNIVIYLGRLSEDTGLNVFIQSLKISRMSKYQIIFVGDGELRSVCERYGRVLGFVNPIKYLLKSKICFAGGYLSILESFRFKNKVLVAYDNPLKEDYYKLTPFVKWLSVLNGPTDLSKFIKLDSEIEEAYEWSLQQTWKKVGEDYIRLWNAGS